MSEIPIVVKIGMLHRGKTDRKHKKSKSVQPLTVSVRAIEMVSQNLSCEVEQLAGVSRYSSVCSLYLRIVQAFGRLAAPLYWKRFQGNDQCLVADAGGLPPPAERDRRREMLTLSECEPLVGVIELHEEEALPWEYYKYPQPNFRYTHKAFFVLSAP